MLRFQFFSFLCIFMGLILLFNVKIKDLIQEIKSIVENLKTTIKPRKTLKSLIFEAKKEKRNNIILDFIDRTKLILIKENDLSKLRQVYIYAGLFGLAGVVVAFLVNNIFLIPILFILFASFPFIFIQLRYYNKRKSHNKDLESAVSNITSSYIRDNMSIVESIKENINYIREPLKRNFEMFVFNYENINSNIKENLEELKSKIDNNNFEEWIDTIISSIDDSNYKNALPYIVSKFSDERIINLELTTRMYEPIYEYILTVIITILAIPFMKSVGEGWYETLIGTTIGKLLIAIFFIIVIISTICVVRILKPVEYRS
ncbi:MAG: hypothetical protein IJ593_05730 [Lachnospiraceae bacterium]|nr:hypothetical protein [Lachnospiraceae bacterium]